MDIKCTECHVEPIAIDIVRGPLICDKCKKLAQSNFDKLARNKEFWDNIEKSKEDFYPKPNLLKTVLFVLGITAVFVIFTIIVFRNIA